MQYVSKRTKSNDKLRVDGAVEPAAAIAAVKKFKATKFDQTVNVCFHLGIDTAQADQALRGSLSLPKGASNGRSSSMPAISSPTTP